MGVTSLQVPSERVRIGVVWRGEAGTHRPEAVKGLGPLFEAFTELPVDVVPVPFGDDRIVEVRAQLRGIDGVLVWVNPIQDGANRHNVDEVLREAAASGVFVSAHPDVIQKMGTKEVLVRTRGLGWGCDTNLYNTVEELAERLPGRLAKQGRLVLKQGRGNGGNGVWSVELVQPASPVTISSPVRVRDARTNDVEHLSLDEFLKRCGQYFAWSGFLIDQEYQARLADGMIRCCFSCDEVIGFCHQWPTGLLDIDSTTPLPDRPRAVMEGPDVPAYQLLRQRAEGEWVPEMIRVLGLDARALPVVWDADFLYGSGDDAYVLCEINVSAVWPFPAMGSATVAANAVARIAESARENGHRVSTV